MVDTPRRFTWFRGRSRPDISMAVRRGREIAGVTQVQLADYARLSRSTVQRLERDEDVSVGALLSAVTELDYEIVIIPRGARIAVEPRTDKESL